MESNPVTSLLGLVLLLQLGVLLLVLLGGLYALYCLNRAASGLDRMASALENWVAHSAKFQARQEAQNRPLPGQNLPDLAPPTPPSEPDWIRPIELPGPAAASKTTPEVVEVVTAKPPFIPPVTPPFGNEVGPETEVKRD